VRKIDNYQLNYSVMKTICPSILKICLVSAFFISLTGMYANGQDVIVKKNGDEIKAKVEQVLDTEIKYRKSENLTGPVYSISKAEVFMIRYPNGSKDVFDSQVTTAAPKTQATTGSKEKISDNDIRPARTGAIINYAVIAPVILFGSVAAITTGSDVSVPMGAVAAGIAGVGIPMGAIIAAKTRRLTGVDGNPGLRITGWAGYGVTMALAIGMLATSEEVSFSAGSILLVTITGSLSSLCLGLDASTTLQEAKAIQNTASLQPTFGYVRDNTGKKYSTIGFRINF
jgi:hypothetical protein